MPDFPHQYKNARIIVCSGSGGVGKTTIAATLGLLGALAGRKTLVLTIDPARRLADTLGIAEFNHQAQEIGAARFESLGLRPAGRLFAMRVDTKRVFDRIVTRHASPAAREKIFANRFYQHVSNNLAGSHEYMAMELLHEIHQAQTYDLIILDTPPSRRALDFLDAPDRLTNLLGHRFFWNLFRPYLQISKWSLQLLTTFTSPFFKVFNQMFGVQTFEDIGDFFRLWDDLLLDGFRKRAQAVKELLASDQALFLVIASPMSGPLREAHFLHDALVAGHMPFGGFIVNRVHPVYADVPQPPSAPDRPLAWDETLYTKLQANFERFRRMGIDDNVAVAALKQRLGPETPVVAIPYFETDIYDFNGLIKISRHLSNTEQKREQDIPPRRSRGDS